MRYCFIIIFFLIATYSKAQSSALIDSLDQLLNKSAEDTIRVKLLLQKADMYYFTKPDSTRIISEEALELARKLNFLRGEVEALNKSGEACRFVGNYPLALKRNFEALQINRQMKDIAGEATSLGFIGFTYLEFREYRKGLEYLLASKRLNEKTNSQLKKTFDLTNIANAYNLLNKPDSGLYYARLSFKTYTGLKHGPLKSLILSRIGDAFAGLRKKDSALQYYRMSWANSVLVNEKVNRSRIHLKIAEIFESDQQIDSSLYHARRAFWNGQQSTQRTELLLTSELLTKLFKKKNNIDSAFFYQNFAKNMTDSVYGPGKFRELQLLMLEEQQRQQEIEQDQERFKNKIKMISLWSAIGIFLIIAFLLYRNNRHKQRVNKILEKTLSDLRQTQSQLIQSEKMASLGELTAGIAHEIQNPLNFVNNFSEINKEMLDELKAERQKPKDKRDDVSQDGIINELIANEEKIIHHGKRADAIVKGMLQHSRTSSGQKESADINALCEEYLRLAYHGLRAKDKSFNASTKTDFDTSIGKIDIVQQEIGRVLLNLINNAFYAVNEKQKLLANGYQPLVEIKTRKINNKIEINVKDNGNGIPGTIKEKIFQPFFTTKPTGQGTGLGLSLSYDIVKAHGGELEVKTREGTGTTFIIQLPIA